MKNPVKVINLGKEKRIMLLILMSVDDFYGHIAAQGLH